MLDKYRVSVGKLKNYCDPNIFPYETTEGLDVERELIGQDRAMEALKYGLSMKRKGYNIYVSGMAGTGKNSYSYIVAKEFAGKKQSPKDWCYVYNFSKPSSPVAISIEAGEGEKFQGLVEECIKKIEGEIPKALSSKEYEENKNKIFNANKKKASELLDELNEFAKQYDFMFKHTEKGLLTIPLVDGKQMTDKELQELSEEEMEKLGNTSMELAQESYELIKEIKNIEVKMTEELEKLKGEVVSLTATNFIGPIQVRYRNNNDINEFLQAMKKDIVKNYNMFLDKKKNEENYIQKLIARGDKKAHFLKRYSVNLFIDNSDTEGAPIVKEMNPNYYNLFGKIEYANELGVATTDHTKIKAGSFHRANGGYIIIQAKDILQNQYAWDTLERILTTEEIKIENITGLNIAAASLDPEPIPLDIKVILVGDYEIHQILYLYDDNFKKLFKIKADFDVEMEKTRENILKTGNFIAYQCKAESLLPFNKKAVCSIIDYSSRVADEKNKLTSRFNELIEIIYEADGWARVHGKIKVGSEDVKKAIDKKRYRNNIYEERTIEMVKDGTIMIDTDGEKVGEINGLSVIDLGKYAFGRASKITANTYFGKDGIINIEKEVEQSGSIHDKGVLILTGYLGERYAQEIQLSLSASITFEQSYGGVDGDSASSTELYALISSLAEIPIKQSIGVTGSVNQKGRIQPIGGVNEKVEGFFRICKAMGFKGGEGVLIPAQNVENLMLNDEVVEAVKDGTFTVYAVATIDEGIEVLTGQKAGVRVENGEFELKTVNKAVQDKLNLYSDISEECEGK